MVLSLRAIKVGKGIRKRLGTNQKAKDELRKERNRRKIQQSVKFWYKQNANRIRTEFEKHIREISIVKHRQWEGYEIKEKRSKIRNNIYGRTYKVNNRPTNKDNIPRQTKLNIATYNITNMNEITKRQQLAAWLNRFKIDIMMVQETKRNTSDVENGETWNGYTAFYSTSIDPKTKATEDKKRDAKLGNKLKGKGKGKGAQQDYTPHWAAPDYEHARVAIIIKNKWVKHLKKVPAINGRLMYVTLNTKGGDLTFISAYSPTAVSDMEKKDEFYENITLAINEITGPLYIGGDMNARIWNRRVEDETHIGEYFIERDAGYVANHMNEKSKESRGLFINAMKTHDLIPVNTWLQKPPEKLVTYKEKVEKQENDIANGPPYDYKKYAQCDFIMTNKYNLKHVINCESDIKMGVRSDHFPVWATIKVDNPITEKSA